MTTRDRKECILLKIYFEKAYDNISWNFIRDMLRRMRCGIKWMAWMEVCVSTNSMLILVNGSPTKDFRVKRDMRHGEPFSPFLFVIVVEDLTGLVKKAMEVEKFQGFKINDEVNFDVLQFIDDTILLREGSWKNLWSIKVILRGFEMILGLDVNICKSKIYLINLSKHLIQVGSTFLSCWVDELLFNFLGVPVDTNPRRISMWNPIKDML